MIRLRGQASRLSTLAFVASASAVILSLAGCSGDDKPRANGPSGSAVTSSPPGTSSTGPKDDSAAVLGWTPPAAVATTKGRIEALSTQAMFPATAGIISVRAGEGSTILTWELSSATDVPLQGLPLNTLRGARDFPDSVRLVDPVGKKSYSVNTVIQDNKVYCVCSTYPIHVGPDPVRMTAQYPPLPAAATSISVRIPNFAPVTVPITR